MLAQDRTHALAKQRRRYAMLGSSDRVGYARINLEVGLFGVTHDPLSHTPVAFFPPGVFISCICG
jgi:hypothetical protein